MTKKACYWINKDELSGFQIRNDGNMYPCPIRWIPLSDNLEKYRNYKSLKFEDINDLRVRFLEELNEGKQEKCQKCPLLHEVETENPLGAIKHLVYHPHTLCTLDCKYCFYTKDQKNTPIPNEYEDVYEVIKHFYDIGLLDKEYFCLDLGGGEPTLLKNIAKTVEFMSNTWEKSKICILSNSTVTEKVDELIEELKGKYNNVEKVLITSIDSGTSKTYEQIRRKDYYYKVANNLCNYLKNNVFDEILLKYIFLDDMSNSDDDDIFGFLHLCKYLDMVNKDKVKISLDIDWLARKHNDSEIPENILKIMGKMYYYITEVLKTEYYFASDYLNQSTQNGRVAVAKILEYSKVFSNSNKTDREVYEMGVLKQNEYNKIMTSYKQDDSNKKNIKDKLQIAIITYNRKDYIERTLKQLLCKTSPIRDFDITILDNASTDGTSELVDEYCQKYSNLKHIRHAVNIGGNANVIKAFELAIESGKGYFWGLCDDDIFDFSNWNEVEKYIEEGKDIICVSNYAIRYNKDNKISLSDKLLQMTFFPAGIYKTDLLEANVLTNMTYSVSDCFPHMCATIHAVNLDKEIVVLENPIVFNGLHCADSCKEVSYKRGTKFIERANGLKNSSWILGYANILDLLAKKSLKSEFLISAILHDEIYGNWQNFYGNMFFKYFHNKQYHYLYQIFSALPKKYTLEFIVYLLKIPYKLSAKKEKKKDIDDWTYYFKQNKMQKKIDKIANKLRGKKVLVYGNGMISQVFQSYNLSKLNITAVTDRKFMGNDKNIKCKYQTIPPNKINYDDYDAIIVAVKLSEFIKNSYRDKGFKKEIIRLV